MLNRQLLRLSVACGLVSVQSERRHGKFTGADDDIHHAAHVKPAPSHDGISLRANLRASRRLR
jgi:hypothetical protein